MKQCLKNKIICDMIKIQENNRLQKHWSEKENNNGGMKNDESFL